MLFLSLQQELQNSILDLSRQLSEAADEKATLVSVQRQRDAELARAREQEAAAKEEAAENARQLASANTRLKACCCLLFWTSTTATSTLPIFLPCPCVSVHGIRAQNSTACAWAVSTAVSAPTKASL
jgi:hypothetical protein